MEGCLAKTEFDILALFAKENCLLSVADVAEKIGCQPGTVNTICESLTNSGWIKDGAITAEGLALLEPYRVKNAIIMAADRYIHFIPVAYENPVGLLAVKGELLIERQIRQLKKSGINDITIVVGYMKEKLVYLQQKFGEHIPDQVTKIILLI